MDKPDLAASCLTSLIRIPILPLRPHSRIGLPCLYDSLNMPTPRSSQLLTAMRKRQFVRFDRRFEDSPVRGYVLDVGTKFFLLALVSDRIWFDGFECFRVGDVRDFRPDTHARFAESALQKRRERLPRKPRVSVRSIEELLVSAGRAFPLVTVHREGIDPDVCWIGRVLGVEHGRVSLLEITPDATWDAKPESFRLSEITRVNFGGDYEAALHLVGGEPGQAIKTVQRTGASRSARRNNQTPLAAGSRR